MAAAVAVVAEGPTVGPVRAVPMVPSAVLAALAARHTPAVRAARAATTPAVQAVLKVSLRVAGAMAVAEYPADPAEP